MSTFDDFKHLYSLSSQLIDELDKEQLAEVARMLALQVVDYERRFGKIPKSDLSRRIDGVGIEM